MSTPSPKVDARTATDIVAALVGNAPSSPGLLEKYTSAPTPGAYKFAPWREYDENQRPIGPSAALIGIFSRFVELAIERLNQVPDKHFRAFLDLVGAAQLPPAPARVPLTFSLVPGRLDGAVVPAGTKVAAQPAAGDKGPVLFEVERAVVVTPVQLGEFVTLDPEQDTIADWGASTRAGMTVFQGDHVHEHVLNVGDARLLGYPSLVRLTLTVELTGAPLADVRVLSWERSDGDNWLPLQVSGDSSEAAPGRGSMTRSGAIELAAPASPWAEGVVDGRANRWLRVRLLTPITPSAVPLANMVRASQLPTLSALKLSVELARSPDSRLAPDAGFTNTAPLDLTLGFFPFGDKPKLFDTFYVASAEAFAKDENTVPGSDRVTLRAELANSHLDASSGRVRPSPDLALVWEVGRGAEWIEIGRSSAPPWFAWLELDPPQPPGTDNVVTLQGGVLPGTRVSLATITAGTDPLEGSAGDSVTPGLDGRFAARRTATGVSVFRVTAALPRGDQRAWAVAQASGFNPNVRLEVEVPSVAPGATRVRLSVRLTVTTPLGQGRVVIANGTTRESSGFQTIQITSQTVELEVGVGNGRNEILVDVQRVVSNVSERLAAVALVVSSPALAPAPNENGFSDGTFGWTQSGDVTFRWPGASVVTTVNGQSNRWLRCRISKGDYGSDASYVLVDPTDTTRGFTLLPARFRAPAVAKLTLGYTLRAERVPEVVLGQNQLAFEPLLPSPAAPAAPFVPPDLVRPALHLGFSLPPRQLRFPNATVSTYAIPLDARYGEAPSPLSPDVSREAAPAGEPVVHRFLLANTERSPRVYQLRLLGQRQERWPAALTTVPAGLLSDAGVLTLPPGASAVLEVTVLAPVDAQPGESDRVFLQARSEPDGGLLVATAISIAGVLEAPEPPRLTWQYWNGTSFAKLAVQDDTQGFLTPGGIQFLPPADFAPSAAFGRERYWVRVSVDSGQYSTAPRVSQLLLNTTVAVQSATVVSEILGSSNGGKDQVFRTTRAPVLEGQQLEVREPELPAAEEQAALQREEGSDAISIIPDAAGRPREIWVRWHEVPDFYGSGARDRHYVIDHLSGEVRFGSGLQGRIPAPGASNVRLRPYRVGGGEAGNRAAGTVTQLKTSVPYVDKVINPAAATGGAEAETLDTLFERVPRTLRHRDRAVTPEDYEDVAKLATPEVARALAVPLRDLAADPVGLDPVYGTTSVVIVPRSGAAKPLPSLELLERVRRFLATRTPAGAGLAVVGPVYLRVEVRAEVAVRSLEEASAVETAVQERLAAFLHPLTGGPDGRGWDFGRAPHQSDILARVEAVVGVDHVIHVEVSEIEEPAGATDSARFLVYSGQHTITLVFEPS